MFDGFLSLHSRKSINQKISKDQITRKITNFKKFQFLKTFKECLKIQMNMEIMENLWNQWIFTIESYRKILLLPVT